MKLKYAHLVPDLPFEIAWTEDKPRTSNPTASKIYAKFRHSGKVWVIYDRVESYTIHKPEVVIEWNDKRKCFSTDISL